MVKDKFLNFIQYEKRFSPNTITAYRKDLEQFYSYLKEHYSINEENEINHYMIRSWLVHLTENGITSRSINRKLSTLKSYFRFLRKEGILDADPMNKIISPKVSSKIPVFVEEDKMDFLFSNVDFGEGFTGIRNKLILELLYSTGIRLSELVNLRETDINLETNSIRVIGKRNKERIIPIGNNLQHSFTKYIQYRNNQFGHKFVYLFLTKKGNPIYHKLVYRIVNNYLNQVTTISKKSPHVLRHTFATHMLNHGADLNAIKEILGHATLSATQVYTHNTIDKLKNIYKQAHPRA
jgi:integrase/recombinase XerC